MDDKDVKYYTVEQVAEMLGTNKETVRRWIRSKKLNSTIDSKKQGNKIAEDSLNMFLSVSSKYKKIAEASAAMIASVAVATIKNVYESDKKEKISTKDLNNFIRNKQEEINKSIKEKEKQVEIINKEIAQLEMKVVQFNALMSDDKRINELAETLNREIEVINEPKNRKELHDEKTRIK